MFDFALGTFVTYNPQAIAPSTPTSDAIELMEQLGIHHLPVVDESQRIVGIVSHRDLISRRLPHQMGAEVHVEKLMARVVFTIDHSAPPVTALKAILEHGFHSVPVLENGVLVGMITSTDFLRELSYGELPSCNDRVDEHMVCLSSDELLFSAATETEALLEESRVVSPDQTLATAAALMLEYDVREIAVMDDFGIPVGILRDDDVLQAIANSLA